MYLEKEKMPMRICAVFPKTTIFENPMVYPPLGLFWIMAVLKEHNHEVSFVDMSETTVGMDGEKIIKYENPPLDYDVYMISGTSPQAREIIRLACFLKENGKLVIGGGPYVTNNAGKAVSERDLIQDVNYGKIVADPIRERSQRQLLENFHILVRHEGERAVIEAIERLDESIRTMQRFGRGIVIEYPLISQSEMGGIPIPDREFAHLYKANLYDRQGNAYPTTTMYSSRGCPHRCAFCDSPALWGRKVRFASPERVKEELQDIYNKNFRGVYFYNEVLFLDRERALRLFEELGQFGFVARGNMRSDIICHGDFGYKFLMQMHDCGLVDVFVGVESGSDQIKNNIHKGTTIEQDTQVLKWCKELGIKFKASVVFGLPGETQVTMEATRRWVLENRPDKVNACLFVPFPGIPIVKGVNIAMGLSNLDGSSGSIGEYGKSTIHDYDVRWDLDQVELEEHCFAGSREPGILEAVVRTSSLTREEIQDFFDRFLVELKKEGISY